VAARMRLLKALKNLAKEKAIAKDAPIWTAGRIKFPE